MLSGLAMSLGFVFASSMVALVLGLVLGFAHASTRLYASEKALHRGVSLTAELLILMTEMAPAAAALLVVSWMAVSFTSEFARLGVLALAGGTAWSAIVARTTSNALTFEASKEYARQVAFWGITPFRELGVLMILRSRMKELGSAAATVAVYAIVADTSVGFLLSFGRDLQATQVRYYAPSLGTDMAKLVVGKQGTLALCLVLLAVGIAGMIRLIDWLERSDVQAYDEVDRTAKGDRDQALTIPWLDLEMGSTKGRGFNLEVRNDSRFSLRQGQVLWLKGASGSGKSLLFKSIVDLVPGPSRTRGEIRFSPDQRRPQDVEIIFQEPSLYLYPYLRLDALSRLTTGQSWSQVARESHGGDAVVDLGNSYADSCSAGQKRIAFSSLVLTRLANQARRGDTERTLCLCDEPDGSLDEENKSRLAHRLAEVASSSGVAVAYVSHDPAMVTEIGQELGKSVLVRECESTEGRSTVVVRDDLLPNDRGRSAAHTAKLEPMSKLAGRPTSLSLRNLLVNLPGDSGSYFRFCRSAVCELPEASVVVLYGANGSGKSTFMKGLSGLYPNECEMLRVGGESLAKLAWSRRNRYIGHVLDDTEKSLPRYKELGWLLRRIAKANATDYGLFEDRVIGFGVPADFGRRLPMELSGGQRQRVAFGVAKYLLSTPVVLLDEPFSRLDADTEQLLVDALFESGRDGRQDQTTYLIVSHRAQKLANGGAVGLNVAQLLSDSRSPYGS